MDTPALLPAETLNICAESTCNFEKVVVRKVERKFEFTPPPQSLSPLESAIYRDVNSPHLAEKPRFCRAFRESGSLRPTPHLFPNSLKATAAVPFLSESGPQVRCLAWLAK